MGLIRKGEGRGRRKKGRKQEEVQEKSENVYCKQLSERSAQEKAASPSCCAEPLG